MMRMLVILVLGVLCGVGIGAVGLYLDWPTSARFAVALLGGMLLPFLIPDDYL